MPYVIAAPCIGSKDRSCVEVCPVDCFYNYPNEELNTKTGKAPKTAGDIGMLIINPDECIHCGACEPECPVEAIFEDEDMPDQWKDYVALNEKVAVGYSDEEKEKMRVTEKDK
ncbi:MAG: ferredoxin family protein [Deltaproteobacteria bacterium]|nr:ferredoxin family protein [Deltaproteobacteria bacterium]